MAEKLGITFELTQKARGTMANAEGKAQVDELRRAMEASMNEFVNMSNVAAQEQVDALNQMSEAMRANALESARREGATRVRNEERAKEAEEKNAKMMKMLELQTAALAQQTTAFKDCQIMVGMLLMGTAGAGIDPAVAVRKAKELGMSDNFGKSTAVEEGEIEEDEVEEGETEGTTVAPIEEPGAEGTTGTEEEDEDVMLEWRYSGMTSTHCLDRLPSGWTTGTWAEQWETTCQSSLTCQ